MDAEAKSVTDFLTRLADEPKLFEEYKEDPEAVMKRAGLSPRSIHAILSGSIAEVREIIKPTVGLAWFITHVIKITHHGGH
ncbi:MAG: hypothetical protein L3K09_00340 [Thermoplasmata archaeon]|nr:hypothetical protein [Thermoplasmata archaeon]